MKVGTALLGALEDWGPHPCLLELCPGGSITALSAPECAARASEVAGLLRSWGIRERYLVPLFLDNSADFIFVLAALLQIGAVPLLVKTDYRRLELAEVFANAVPQAVVAEDRCLAELAPFLDGSTTVVTRSAGALSLRQVGEALPAREDIPDELASINYTYRGYGYPLGAMISHAQYLDGARMLQKYLQGLAGEKMLVIIPMAHIFTLIGCILAPLLHRMSVAVAATLHPRRIFDYIREARIDYITCVPEVYEMLARLRDQAGDLSSLKAFVSGGSLLTPEGYRGIADAFGVEVLHGYGLTELTPVSGNIRGGPRPGTVGPLCDGVECRIEGAGEDGVGEILVRTAGMIGSYYRRPRESSEVFDGGWLRTGDLGRVEAGHLLFHGEKKQTRKVNGLLVDLEELRRAFFTDPDVERVELDCSENSIAARIALGRETDFERKVADLRCLLRRLVAPHKIPRLIARL